MMGPHTDELGDEASAAKTPEELARVTGKSIGFGLSNALPDAPIVRTAAKKAVIKVKPVLDGANEAMKRAREMATKRQIPVDAATATQNKAVAAVQMAADHSPGGAIIAAAEKNKTEQAMIRTLGEFAKEAHPNYVNPVDAGAGTRDAVNKVLTDQQTAETQGLRTTAADLASQVHPTRVDPVQMGADARGRVESNIGEHHATADSEYGNLHERENNPANRERVQVGTRKVKNGEGKEITEPVFEEMGMPVHIKEVRKQIKPVFRPHSLSHANRRAANVKGLFSAPEHHGRGRLYAGEYRRREPIRNQSSGARRGSSGAQELIARARSVRSPEA